VHSDTGVGVCAHVWSTKPQLVRATPTPGTVITAEHNTALHSAAKHVVC
jgi:hypothetical protein